MGKYDFEEESSSSSDDEASLRHDIASLSTACLPLATAADSSDDEDDDLELVRIIKQQYGGGDDISKPLSLKPLSSLPPIPSDDEDDDFETLRAIQQRFSQYCGGNRCDKDVEVKETKNDLGKSPQDDVVGMPFVYEALEECREDTKKDSFDLGENPETFGYTSSFPKAAQTFVEAIKKNRSCQKFIRTKLLHIEADMEKIKELLKRVKILRAFQMQCKKKISKALSQKHDARIQLISTPKQRSKAAGKSAAVCYGPQENSHAACYKTTLTKFPLSFERKNWSQEERENLEKGIIQQFQETLLKSAFQEPEYADGLDSIISSITNIDITPEMIQDFSGKVNWGQLASMYSLNRSGPECETRWLNFENRLINHNNWTRAEDKQLLLLIQYNGINDWCYIAENLKTNRTPFQCLARYQRSLNASILKRDWSEDEDAQLRSAVESFGESNWQAVASVLEGRTGTQCSNRWKKTLHPTRQRVGKWSDDEDKRLRVAVILFGHKSWHRIAEFVPGRTQAQCRERWVNVLDPSLKRGGWTEEEDMKLEEAIKQYGYCWSKVAASVPMRTDNQCRRRWKRLFPHEVPKLRADRSIQKVALISNFVDRESERPALGPSDFVPLSTGGSTELELDNVPQTSKKSRNTSQEARTGKSKKRARSPKVKLSSDCTDDGDENGKKNEKNKRLISSSVSKEKRFTGSVDSAAERKKKSRSKETEETKETETENVPVNIRSRRPQGVKSKSTLRKSEVSMLQASDLDGVNKNTVVYTSYSGELLDQSEASNLHLKSSEDDECDASNIDHMAGKQSSFELLPEMSLVVPRLSPEVRPSSYFTKTHSMVSDGSSRRKIFQRLPKQSKLCPNKTEEWEDLPLSVLFSETVGFLRRRISVTSSKGRGK